MKNLIQAAVVFTLFAASAAQAQQAVQWRVQDGGNGHWYAFDATLTSWQGARSIALGLGGDLASLASDAERTFWMSRIPIGAGAPGCAGCTWLGGFQDRLAPDYAEPTGGWRWSDGTQWSYTFWNAGEPNNLNGQDYLYGSGPTNGRWDDSSGACCAPFVVEWSADCNGDGIVDYGQCRDGSLPDYNGNNIPDCCESGTPCIVGNYPVQWQAQNSGNGHWYQRTRLLSTWTVARSIADAAGGHLVTLTTAQEQSFVLDSISGSTESFWIGLYQDTADPGYREPAGAWRWVTSEPLIWTAWNPQYGGPNNYGGHEDVGEWTPSFGSGWNDLDESWDWARRWTVIEWSTDCNDDGIVDKGQILLNQLPDANDNGIPDGCEQPTCRDADLVLDGFINGLDLGIMLGQWGPNTPPTESDLNQDGSVDGVDLGLLLSYWGPCPY